MAFSLFPGDVAFGVAFAFLFGAFAANLNWNVSIIGFFLSAVLFFLAFARSPLWRVGIVFALSVAAGIFYFYYFEAQSGAAINLPFGKQATFTAIIEDEPQPSETALLLPVRAEAPLAGTVTIFASLASDFAYGDEIKITGTIEPPDPKKSTGPAVFSPRALVRIKAHRGFWLREQLIGIKDEILRIYERTLPQDEAALLGGIAFGSKVSFKKELKSAMAMSGTTHLVAISGYNITIVVFAVGAVFGRYFSRRITFVLSVIFLILFILMVGTEASAVRAALMGFLALVAREMGRPFSMRNAITLTAAGMTFIDPTALVRSMSFVLSFLSLLGIVYVGPPLTKLIRGKKSNGGVLDWKESALMTLSAQVAVLPALLRTFGQFSATAILANVLVLGTVPFTMFLGFLLAAAGFVSIPFSFLMGKMTGLLLGYQLSVIRFFAKFAVPLPAFFNSDFSIALYYCVLVVFVISYGRHDRSFEKI